MCFYNLYTVSRCNKKTGQERCLTLRAQTNIARIPIQEKLFCAAHRRILLQGFTASALRPLSCCTLERELLPLKSVG